MLLYFLLIFSFPYVFHLLQHYWCFLDYYSSGSSNPSVLFTQYSNSLILTCSRSLFVWLPSQLSCGDSSGSVVWSRASPPRTRFPHFSILSSVQLLSRVQLFATPWTAAHHASLSITNSQSLPKLMSIELVMPSNHLILCRPLLLPAAVFPSIRVFSNESALHIRWPKYWSFSFSISPFNEYLGLISFRMDWLDLLAVQGTVKSLLYFPKDLVAWSSKR